MAFVLKLKYILRNVAFLFELPGFLKDGGGPAEWAVKEVCGLFFGLDGGPRDCSLTDKLVCFIGI